MGRKTALGDNPPDIDAILRNAPTQLKVYRFIDTYKESHNGNSPPRSKIAAHLKCTTQNVDVVLMRLADKGLIAFDEDLQPMIALGVYLSGNSS
jgi:DNA-binding MarR family transcriptional regulator